jgi:long-chain fatty acid transport protein
MKKVLCCALGLSLFTVASAFASGYRIPEQSYNATAKAGANIASASGADAAYYNPAGAAWIKDGWLTQVDLSYIYLSPAEYNDSRSSLYNGQAKAENFLLPTLFFLTPSWKDFRFGLSFTAPYGLAKRWDDLYPKTTAEKFSLQVFDLNPTLTYALSDKFSIAGGVRMIYASATVMSNGTVDPTTGTTASRYLSGSTTEWGYNLAADLRPTKELNMAVTFRSRVDLNFTGDAILSGQIYNPALAGSPNGSGVFGNPYAGLPYSQIPPTVKTRGSVTVPAPAVLAFSIAYDFGKTTAELTVDRTYWSSYKYLDFSYDNPAVAKNPVISGAFSGKLNRDWHDTTAIRLGLEHKATDKLTLMAGVCYDESPAPDYTLGFELPDSDAWLFSLGARYAFTDNLEVGLGALYDAKRNRWVDNGTIDGEITNEAAILVSLGVQYRF